MNDKISFSATGDSLMVKRLPKGYRGFEPIAKFIKTAEAKLTNLETILSNYDCFPSSYSGGTWVNSTPDILPDLLSYGFNLCGCANNHSMDYSYDGLKSTMKVLDDADVAYAGIGMNLYEASRPTVIDLPSARVGMISITSTFNDAARAGKQGEALKGRPGLNFLRSNTVYTITPEHMKTIKEIAEATHINGEKNNSKKAGFTNEDPDGFFSLGDVTFREGGKEAKHTYCNEVDLNRTKRIISDALNYVDYVIVMAHSHQIKRSFYHEPDYFFEEFCRSCIASGACAVIGGGTHQLKPIEIYKGKPIFYSLGNFIFQNNLVRILPPDFMEKYNLPLNATTAEALNARSKNGTIGLQTDFLNYRSVIPYFEIECEQLTKLILKPIELGFDLPRTFKGLPYEADKKTEFEIYEHLKDISKSYGTDMHLDNGIIEVRL